MQDDNQLIETVISKKSMFNGALIDVEHWTVRLPDGSTALREAVLHCGAVAVVPVDENGNVTMVRQHRVVMDSVTWEIPAGKLDSPDEDPLSAAKRELAEETGLTASDWRKLTDIYTTPGFCNEKISLYLAKGLERHPAHPDPGEFVSTGVFPLGALVARCLNGTLHDSKTQIGLLATYILETDHDSETN